MSNETDLIEEMQVAMKLDYGKELSREEAQEAMDQLTDYARCFILVAETEIPEGVE